MAMRYLRNEKKAVEKFQQPHKNAPPRVELGSREPESHVRSITLRARQQILYYLKQKGIASII
ncbi:hypothetical protein LR3_02720 [Limosilactobacillus reuteri]|uniref:Uncharacterized protein n=1 Tax=Limosilactobacillus reuteri TaxID=1598 RepID=A0A073JNI5_LIMRT|nr:hypothetical protein LR3_02720 [Limosilactobacillus reuteri]